MQEKGGKTVWDTVVVFLHEDALPFAIVVALALKPVRYAFNVSGIKSTQNTLIASNLSFVKRQQYTRILRQ